MIQMRYFPSLKYIYFLVYSCKIALRLKALNPQKYSANYRVCLASKEVGYTLMLHPLETNRIAVSVESLIQDFLVVNASQLLRISFRCYTVYSISKKDHDAPKHQRHPMDSQLKMKTTMLPVKIKAMVCPVNNQAYSIHNQ
jgi:hypothetical protein